MNELFFTISNYVGLFGVTIILLAYFLLSTGRMSSDTKIYHTINFAGAWLILFSLFFHWNLSSVVIEIAWILISSIGFYRVILRRT
jgi:hypothetical protein